MMLEVYQNLPYVIDPSVFTLGFFSLRWYALMYIVGVGMVYVLLVYRIRKGEAAQMQKKQNKAKLQNIIPDFLLYAFTGALLGGRLGYVLFYNLPYYAKNPLAVVSPLDPLSGQYVGIYGMSYFGAFVAVTAVTWLFCHKQGIDFWKWADFIVPAIPAGYFFGRIGNFLNGELYGRVTTVQWGMYFPSDPLVTLRHPSQLYEAFFEGLLLFLILWTYRNRAKFSGQLVLMYGAGYAIARFFCEFFRQNDPQTDLLFREMLTKGQIFSLILISIVFFGYLKRKKYAILA